MNQDPVETGGQVVLASASPRRSDLLGLLGISFSVRAADVDEAAFATERPEDLTTRLARSKALTVATLTSASRPPTSFSDISRSSIQSRRDESTGLRVGRRTAPDDVVVLAADTVVVLDDVVLGKPGDAAEATAMLGALRGREHRVLTGMALAVAGEIVWTSVVETAVRVRDYGADEVERYVRSGSPLDKAGAYGIQDAFRPVERLEGCFTNVVGLPLCEVRRALAATDPDRRWGPDWCPTDVEGVERDVASERRGSERDCRLCDRARELCGVPRATPGARRSPDS